MTKLIHIDRDGDNFIKQKMIAVGTGTFNVRLGSPPTYNAGKPVFVIEAGAGWHSVMYQRVQDALSKHSKTISYDRAGLGRSPAITAPEDALNRASQLSSLLVSLMQKQPVILVGHSIASLYFRVLFNSFDHNIVGIVLLDPSHPDQRGLISFRVPLYERIKLAVPWLFPDFILPPIRVTKQPFASLPIKAKNELGTVSETLENSRTRTNESGLFRCAAKQAENAGDFGDTPLLVLSAGVLPRQSRKFFKYPDLFMGQWAELQRRNTGLSTNSKHHVISGATHGTIVTQKECVEKVSRLVLKFLNSIEKHKVADCSLANNISASLSRDINFENEDVGHEE